MTQFIWLTIPTTPIKVAPRSAPGREIVFPQTYRALGRGIWDLVLGCLTPLSLQLRLHQPAELPLIPLLQLQRVSDTRRLRMPLSRGCEDFSRCRKRHILRMGWWRGSFSKEGEGTTIIGPRDSKEGVVIGERLGGDRGIGEEEVSTQDTVLQT